jgi:hypothetical protein
MTNQIRLAGNSYPHSAAETNQEAVNYHADGVAEANHLAVNF